MRKRWHGPTFASNRGSVCQMAALARVPLQCHRHRWRNLSKKNSLWRPRGGDEGADNAPPMVRVGARARDDDGSSATLCGRACAIHFHRHVCRGAVCVRAVLPVRTLRPMATSSQQLREVGDPALACFFIRTGQAQWQLSTTRSSFCSSHHWVVQTDQSHNVNSLRAYRRQADSQKAHFRKTSAETRLKNSVYNTLKQQAEA